MILITVFDGLRPDFVRPDLTPVLWRLRQRGVWFAESHCVFPSVTRVNAPALATGSFPSGHAIPGNQMYVRAVEPGALLNTGRHEDLRRLGAHGPLLGVPALAEVLAGHGRRAAVVGTGSSGCTYLLHPDANARQPLFHAAFCEPPSLRETAVARLGAPPSDDATLSEEARASGMVAYGARLIAELLVPEHDPDVVFFWSTVPDGFQHHHGLGAPAALAALREADRVFGELLKRAAMTAGAEPDVIVTSDHGYATVSDHLHAGDLLRESGLVTRPWFEDTAIAADGGALQIYLPGDDGQRREALAAHLLAQPWLAAVFTRDGGVAGTHSLVDANYQSVRSPDILCAFAWDHGHNAYGAAGRSLGAGAIAIGAGDHGGISPFEMHNTLIAAGPSFRQGWIDTTPCGITDVAPTALACLGLPVPASWSGRVLSEALRDRPAQPQAEARHERLRRERRLPGGQLAVQELVLARAAASSYVCQANKWLA